MDQKLTGLEKESAEIREWQAQMKAEISAMKTQLSALKQMDTQTFFSEQKEKVETLKYSSPGIVQT